MDTRTPSGQNPPQNGSSKKTLRDLVDEQDTSAAANSFLTPKPGSDGSALRLAFPGQEQLASFVAAHYQTLLAGLKGLGQLKLIAGGPLQTKRLYAVGRSAAPDLLFETEEGQIVVVALHRDPPVDVRLNLGTELKVIQALHGKARGIIITPTVQGAIAKRISEYVAEVRTEFQVDWVRYTINMEIDAR